MALSMDDVIGDITSVGMENMSPAYSNVTSPHALPSIEEFTAGMFDDNLLRSFPYLQTSPKTATLYLVVMGTMIATGVTGSVLIIGAYIVNKNLRTPGNEFTVNLAIADLCVTAVADPMCILGVTHGKEFFAKRPFFCEMVASMCLSACFCAFLSLSMLTLNRYVYVCHQQFYHKLFRRKIIIMLCLGIWVMAVLLELPNFIGWGGHFFDQKSMQCIWNRTASMSYTFMVSLVFMMVPLILMLAAYSRIFLKIKESKKKLMAHAFSGQLSHIQIKKKELKETLRLSKSIFIVVISFLVCWTPYAMIIMIDINDRFPIWIHLWATLLAHAHSSINVFIYGFTNPHFIHGYRKFLRLSLCLGDQPYSVSFGSSSSDRKKEVRTPSGNTLSNKVRTTDGNTTSTLVNTGDATKYATHK